VEAFAVDPTGAADAGAQINAALAAMSGANSSGQAASLSDGTYLCTTALVNPNNVPILVASGVGVNFTGANAASFTAAVLRRAVRQNLLATQAILMFSGNSETAGGTSTRTNETNSWRTPCLKSLRSVRGNLKLLGNHIIGLFDNRLALPASNPPGDSDFGDWRCAATGGYTLAQIDAQATTVE